MPVTAPPDSTPAAFGDFEPSGRPVASHNGRRNSSAQGRSPWLRLAVLGALLAIAVQLLVMAQLAQHQVQRGVNLRQAQADKTTDAMASAHHEVNASLRTASASQNHANARAAIVHVLR